MREIVLLPGSLFGEVWETRLYWMQKIRPDDRVIVFAHFDKYCEAAGLEPSYRTVIDCLRRTGVQTVTAPEDSLEGIFLRGGLRELYLTPSRSTETVVMAASGCCFTGPLLMFGASEAEQEITNLAPMVRAYSAAPHAGLKSLDKRDVCPDHSAGSMCYYTLNGKHFSQQIQPQRQFGSGAEGYLLPSKAAGLCIKIWDGIARFAFANEKISAMIRQKFSHPYIALPLAFVYNASHEPIGIVMKQFSGREVRLDELRYCRNALHLAGEVLRQCIWLQARGFVHCDLFHNVLIDEEKSEAHTIDMESVQFGSFPTTATSLDRTEYMPRRFARNNAFRSTIQMTYTTLIMLIMLYAGNDDSFADHLLWDSRAKCDRVNDALLRTLPAGLQTLVVQAYRDKCPVSLTQQLNFVTAELAAQSETEYEAYDAAENDDCEPQFEDASDDDFLRIADNIAAFEDSAGGYSRGGESRPAAPHNPPAKAASSAPRSRLVRMLQLLIMKLFGGLSGTVPSTLGAEMVDPWDAFLASKRWKKPMLVSILTVVLIVMMLIAYASI